MPAHQELATPAPIDDEEPNEFVDEPEPELEALADEAPSEAVSVDAEVLGDPEPGEEFPAGPGDAPVGGPDETLESGGAAVSASRTTRTAACRSRSSQPEEAREDD